MGRLAGKVALITGAARGQGRSHALRLAEEGADIIAIDICAPAGIVQQARSADLAETVKLVEALGRRILPYQVDVRDLIAMEAVAAAAVETFGRLDVVCANAGIASYGGFSWEIDSETWQEMIDVNLTGVWKTIRVTVPHMIQAGNGGSIILISSTAAIVAIPGASHYSAAKSGITGLSKALAQELAPHFIRVNTIHSTAVNTDMIHNEATYKLFARGKAYTTLDEVKSAFTRLNAIPVPWVEPVDISNAVLFLASEEARYVTGCMLTVDCGSTIKYAGT